VYQREDDQPDKVRTRLQTMKPPADMLDHYRRAGKLREVDGMQAVEKVSRDLADALDGGSA
jgi:adenylate kinase family enzyme